MDKKKQFILDEIYTLSWSAGVSRSIIYKNKNIDETKRNELKKFVKDMINNNYIKEYSNRVNDSKHMSNIEEISLKTSNQFGDILYCNRFRIGTSQKILNLYLKYLWCIGDLYKPPHCPIDRIILDQLKKICQKSDKKSFSVSWTKLDEIKDYKKIIELAKKIVDEDLSDWELNYWSSIRK